MRKLIFGCGYLGRRVAQLWRQAGHQVVAVTRSSQRAGPLQAAGVEPLVADITRPASLPAFSGFDTILFAVGYDRTSDQSLSQVYVDGLRNVLQQLPQPPARFLYISSTGVYGDESGDWIDENTACRPAREGGRACWQAEQLLQGSMVGPVCVVLRLAGIYGPGRIPRRGDLLAGRPIAAPQDGYMNLIHVDDAAQIVVAADERAAVPNCFVVADGQPVLRGDYYRELARLLAAPAPQFTAADPSSAAAQRAASSRRVNNARMMQQLGVTLRYPSYREGLAAIVAAERSGELHHSDEP